MLIEISYAISENNCHVKGDTVSHFSDVIFNLVILHRLISFIIFRRDEEKNGKKHEHSPYFAENLRIICDASEHVNAPK